MTQRQQHSGLIHVEKYNALMSAHGVDVAEWAVRRMSAALRAGASIEDASKEVLDHAQEAARGWLQPEKATCS